MKIRFLGATETVTGSNYYVETEQYKFLIDCGQFQGSSAESRLNFEPFQFDPKDLDFMILTHSHIDHSGRIPKLVKEGFTGKILCTRPTADLTGIMLLDSAKIHEIDSESENRKRQRAGLEPVDPLYSIEDAELAICYLYPIEYDAPITIFDGLTIHFREAGHLLGSSWVEINVTERNETKKLVFSGDLGTGKNEMLRPPVKPIEADYIIMESTYGNRLHKELEKRFEVLLTTIIETVEKGGTVIIPSFAAGRTQEIIYGIRHLVANEDMMSKFFEIDFFADSPLAINITNLYVKNKNYLSEEINKHFDTGLNPLEFPNLKFINDMSESIGLNRNPKAKVIISASGMCDAGRIKHHLKHYLWRENTTIVFVGYQATESIGRMIQSGQEFINLFNEDIKNNAKVVTLSGFSGHADQENLLDWLSALTSKPVKLFITHGEAKSRITLKEEIEKRYNYTCEVPKLNYEYNL